MRKPAVGDMVSPKVGDMAGKMAVVMEWNDRSHVARVQFTKRVKRRIVRRNYAWPDLMIQATLEEPQPLRADDEENDEAPSHTPPEVDANYRWLGLVGKRADIGGPVGERLYRDTTLHAIDQTHLGVDLAQTIRAYVAMPQSAGGVSDKPGGFDYPQVLMTPGGNALVYRGRTWQMFYSFEDVRESMRAAMERGIQEYRAEQEAKEIQAAKMAKEREDAAMEDRRGPYGFGGLTPPAPQNSYGSAYQVLVERTDRLQTAVLLLAAALQNAAANLDENVGEGRLEHETFHLVDDNARTAARLVNAEWPLMGIPGPESDEGEEQDLEDLSGE